MTLFRTLFFLLGLAAVAWGIWLALEFALPLNSQSFFTTGWIIAGPIAHDAVLAPLVGITGAALSSVASRHWRAPLIVGAVLSGVLTLLAIPLLWRTYGTAPLPGLHDGNTSQGLLISLGVVWFLVLVIGIIRQLHSRFNSDTAELGHD